MVGLGTDIVEIDRLDHSIEKYGQTFLNQVLTQEEQAIIPALPARRREFIAGRWAAKEAVAKALGCGFGAQCGWQDIIVLPDEQGCPLVQLRGSAAETAKRLGIRKVFLSISHEKNYATAVALAE